MLDGIVSVFINREIFSRLIKIEKNNNNNRYNIHCSLFDVLFFRIVLSYCYVGLCPIFNLRFFFFFSFY